MAGLKAPPHGTPSTTSRKASNSCSPQKDGTALAGPASPPGGASAPDTRASVVRRSFAPRLFRSSPLIRLSIAGNRCSSTGIRVAVTTTASTASGRSSACATVASATQAAPAIRHRIPNRISSPIIDGSS